ncbi:hypothetical protein CQA65_30825, partial [Klebsiella pneumoniae]
DDPQNAAARENLYYVLREQNKSAEAQAMLQTLPQSLTIRRTRRRGKTSITCCASRINPPRRRRCCRLS